MNPSEKNPYSHLERGKTWLIWVKQTATQQIFAALLDAGKQVSVFVPVGETNPKEIQSSSWDILLLECNTAEEVGRLLPTLPQHKPILLLMPIKPTTEEVLAWVHQGITDVIWPTPNWQQSFRDRWLAKTPAAFQQVSPMIQSLLQEMARLNEEFFHRLTKMARQIGEMNDQIHPQAPSHFDKEPPRILIVEENFWLSRSIPSRFQTQFAIYHAPNGGMALDLAAQRGYQLLLIDAALPDLPAKTVARSVLSHHPEALVVMFQQPGDSTGKAIVFDEHRELPLINDLSLPQQLTNQLPELIEIQRKRSRERRYLLSFRQEHYELLRQYREIKQSMRSLGLSEYKESKT